jgi:hypothetical protein
MDTVAVVAPMIHSPNQIRMFFHSVDPWQLHLLLSQRQL